MLRIRTKTNKTYKIGSDVSFIEICDTEGNLGALIFIEDGSGAIKIARPGDSLYENYLIKYKVTPSGYVKHSIKSFST
jgi:hypothetical protein